MSIIKNISVNSLLLIKLNTSVVNYLLYFVQQCFYIHYNLYKPVIPGKNIKEI